LIKFLLNQEIVNVGNSAYSTQGMNVSYKFLNLFSLKFKTVTVSSIK